MPLIQGQPSCQGQQQPSTNIRMGGRLIYHMDLTDRQGQRRLTPHRQNEAGNWWVGVTLCRAVRAPRSNHDVQLHLITHPSWVLRMVPRFEDLERGVCRICCTQNLFERKHEQAAGIRECRCRYSRGLLIVERL